MHLHGYFHNVKFMLLSTPQSFEVHVSPSKDTWPFFHILSHNVLAPNLPLIVSHFLPQVALSTLSMLAQYR